MIYEKDKIRRLIEYKDKITNAQIKNDLEWIVECYNEYFNKLPNNSFDRANKKCVDGFFAIDIISFNDNDNNPVYAIRYKIGDVKYTMFNKRGGEYSYHYDLFYITKDDLERIAYLGNGDQAVVFPYGNDPYSESEDGYIQHYRLYGPSYPSLPQPGRTEWTITERNGKIVVRFTLPYEAFSQLEAVLEYGPYYEMEYKYFKKALEVIEENIVAMENFLRVYKNTKAEHINELLKKTYSIPRKRLMMLDDREAEEWLDQKRKEKSKYPVFDEAGLTVTAFDGTLVRSRAEALQYEAYYIYNLPVIFEYPYKIGNELYRPDFLSLDVYLRRDVISEHLGNWFHENDHKRNKYRNESIHRIDEYTKIGFYPEDNLMLTFGTNDRVFNAQSIHRKVALMAFPPPDKDTIEMLRRA